MSEITQLLIAMETDGDRAAEELLPLVYQELRRHAALRIAREPAGQTLQATALVHEAWMRLVGGGHVQRWQNRGHFFGAAAEAMRRILIEQARRKARIKRGGEWVRVDFDGIDVADATPDEKILLVDEALERLKELDPEKGRVVVLKFYLGLSNQEAAECLGVTERTVERQWAYSRAWLFGYITNQQKLEAGVG